MTATYWVVKYVADPIRNEPKNVGIFLLRNGEVSARFFGEREDGYFDGRVVRGAFLNADIYKQWVVYWRKMLSVERIAELTQITTQNIYVTLGGEISDTGLDEVESVCAFVYGVIVGDGPVEAYGWNVEAALDADLISDVSSEFAKWGLLEDMPNKPVAHPVQRGQKINGTSGLYTPSFSQKNGKLHVMEYIDLGLRKQKQVRERAGWMAYMFNDIRAQHDEAQFYSLVRPEREVGGEVAQFARSALGSTSFVVNWADDTERRSFLASRQAVAISLG